jgi:hypothetical protein
MTGTPRAVTGKLEADAVVVGGPDLAEQGMSGALRSSRRRLFTW